MVLDADSLAVVIGVRVRHERTGRGWTLDELAAAADVSRRMVVKVEQGAVNPSIGTLLRLSGALGISLPALVEPPHGDRGKVTRAGEGAVLWSGEAGGRGVLVAGSEPPNVVELWDWTLYPGEAHTSGAHPSGTRELLEVLEGVLALTVADETFTLGVGDAITFHGDEPHSYGNSADAVTRFLLTVYEPGVGIRRRAETSHA